MSLRFGGTWRHLLPHRIGWLELFVTPTSLALVVCLLATIYSKAHVLRDLAGVSAWPLALLWSCSFDLLFYMGMATVFTAADRRWRSARLVTIPVSLSLLVFSLVNAWYLAEAGEQLSWDAIVLGLDRFADLWSIAGELASNTGLVTIVVVIAATSVPIFLAWRLRARGHDLRNLDRVRAVGVLAATGALFAVLLPAPSRISAQRVGGNALVSTYVGWLTQPATDEMLKPGAFAGYEPAYLVALGDIHALASAAARPNVLVVVLESTRYDHTSLAPAAQRRGRPTPNLAALGARGTVASQARAVVPHTSKSLFTMLCGRYPALQLAIVEFSAQFHAQCMADILARAGYRTGFFQSSWGVFEERMRLVGNMGYRDFQAWEDIQGESLGYLASDDLSLPDAVARWLDRGAADQPFFGTVLTSATHHPYRLPASVAAMARASGAPTDTDEQRYSLLVEAEDVTLGQLLRVLAERGHADDTLVVVSGDHGEGFGAKGIRQHDNNFYEEGLRVPLVFAGPGVPTGVIDANVSVGDVTPTLLGRLGLSIAPEVRDTVIGRDLLAGPVPADRDLMFQCWNDVGCRGFVRGHHKIVHLPRAERAFMFDLAADPDEHHDKPVAAEYRLLLPSLGELVQRFRTKATYRFKLAPVSYGAWICSDGKWCRHPNEARPR